MEYNSLEPEAPAVLEGRRPLPGWPQQVGGVEGGGHGEGRWVGGKILSLGRGWRGAGWVPSLQGASQPPLHWVG